VRPREGPTLRAGLLLAAGLAGLAGCGEKLEYRKIELEPGLFEIRNPDGVFRYLSAVRAKEAGVGIRIGRDAERIPTVLEVFPGSPAQGAGLQVGDKLLKMDNVPLKGLDVDDAAGKIRGTPGSPVVLQVKRGATIQDVALRRAKEIMQFTDFPPGIMISPVSKSGLPSAECPKKMDGSCNFLEDAGSACFYSCPLK